MNVELTPTAFAVFVSRVASRTLSPVAQSAAKHERILKGLVLRAAKAAQASVSMDDLEHALGLGHPGAGAPLHVVEPALAGLLDALIEDWRADLLGEVAHRTFTRSLEARRKTLPDALLNAMQSGADATPKLAMKFDLTNEEAVAWARKRAALLITDITVQAREAIREVVASSFDAGIAPRDVARLIRSSIGLTEKDAQAVMRKQLGWLRADPQPNLECWRDEEESLLRRLRELD